MYDLGEFGSVLVLRWAGGPSDEALTLELSALDYPVSVYPRWPGLRRQQRVVRLRISSDTITVRPVR